MLSQAEQAASLYIGDCYAAIQGNGAAGFSTWKHDILLSKEDCNDRYLRFSAAAFLHLESMAGNANAAVEPEVLLSLFHALAVNGKSLAALQVAVSGGKTQWE